MVVAEDMYGAIGPYAAKRAIKIVKRELKEKFARK